ncbi:hypothetical protein Pan153_56910 [Gimesia panareensis]|uniref:Uncharacterized protein n=1 Tax=Gimesia panareensis TaxID=2527978 RepID=A0A518FXA5_9PLAN|nr:class I SAM-dependent methyltransferase [Gimesia panareensis]QDV21009.1 hypothetical protein Pan153_56910 [Gimesia panareensis]
MTTSFAELTISPERTAAFENQLQQKINQGSLAMLIALGYRTGLWKVLSRLDHATYQEISAESGLNAVYVADWLSAMLGGGLIDYDPIFQTYRLPREHAEILTGSTQYEEALCWLPLLGKLEDELAVCLSEGTALPEVTGDRLLTAHKSEQSASFTNQLFQSILPLVPGLIMRLCEGLDVLDLGCGDGVALLELAAAFPESRFVGYDPSAELIEQARHSAISRELENVSFFQRDLTAIHAIQSFDLITAFDVNLEGSDQDRMLREVQSALRPAGLLLLRELAVPRNRDENLQHPLSALLLLICSVRSLAGDAPTGTGKRRGQEALCRSLEAAGLGNLECHQLSQDVLHEYYIARQS